MIDDEPDPAVRRRVLARQVADESFRAPAAAVIVDLSARSKPAPGGAINEDHFLVLRFGRQQETLTTSLRAADLPPTYDEHGYAMLVADGMGRGGAGALASRMALATAARLSIAFGRWNLRIDDRTAAVVSERLEWLYQRVEETLNFHGRSDPTLAGMGTTMTAAFSAGADLFLAHVGHSRAYLYRDGELTQLTRDQTLAQRLADQRGPAPINLLVQDPRHLLTDALGGVGAGRIVDVGRVRLRDDDYVVLATDGLTAFVGDEDIADALGNRRTLDEQSELLVDLAVHRGATDDITVIIARYGVPQDATPA